MCVLATKAHEAPEGANFLLEAEILRRHVC